MRVGAYPHGVYVSRNLTSDRETGIGAWTEQQIAAALRDGRAPERALNPIAMPWIFFHAFTRDDALAIASYLKTLRAVRNQIPAPLHYGFVETVVGKLLAGPPAANPTLALLCGRQFRPDDSRSAARLGAASSHWRAMAGPIGGRGPVRCGGTARAARAARRAGLAQSRGSGDGASDSRRDRSRAIRDADPARDSARADRGSGRPGRPAAERGGPGEPGASGAGRSGTVSLHRGLVRHVPRDGRQWWPQGQLGSARYLVGAKHHARLHYRTRALERCADRPRHPCRRQPRRPGVALAGDDLGSRVELGRRGHPGARRLLAKSPGGAACDSGSARARAR